MNASEPTQRYVLLADVIGSTEISDRSEFRDDLLDGIRAVNREFGSDLYVEFGLIKGVDEFGAVLSDLRNVYEMISTLLNRVHPVRIRFGVAADDVDINPDNDDVGEMDGPAFHRADRLIREVESDDLYIYIDTDLIVDLLVANNINLLLMQREQWTAHQVEAVQAYERSGTQSDAAELLGIQQQTVSKALNTINYGEIKLLREYLRDVIDLLYHE